MKFLVSRRNNQTKLSIGLCSLIACSQAPQIETTLINPCNQVGLDQVDFLGLSREVRVLILKA